MPTENTHYVYLWLVPAVKWRGDDMDHYDSENMSESDAINFAADCKAKFLEGTPFFVDDMVVDPKHYRSLRPTVRLASDKRSRKD